MNEKQLGTENIKNLTLLWEEMGARTCLLQGTGIFRASVSWPNRCWREAKETTKGISGIAQCCDKAVQGCIFPLWSQPDEPSGELEKILTSSRFEMVLEQTAMCLKLSDCALGEHTADELVPVDSDKDIDLWTKTAARSFAYDIDISVIRNIAPNPDVKLFLLYPGDQAGQAAASVMLFSTGDVVGVHQLGVLPEYRGQGIATKVMKNVINICHESPARYITLQASIAGEGLYTKLGFMAQFRFSSYKRLAD